MFTQTLYLEPAVFLGMVKCYQFWENFDRIRFFFQSGKGIYFLSLSPGLYLSFTSLILSLLTTIVWDAWIPLWSKGNHISISGFFFLDFMQSLYYSLWPGMCGGGWCSGWRKKAKVECSCKHAFAWIFEYFILYIKRSGMVPIIKSININQSVNCESCSQIK